MLNERRKQTNIPLPLPLKRVLGNVVAPRQAEAQITEGKRAGPLSTLH